MQTEANMQVHLLISARFYASFGGTVNKLYCFHGRFGCNFHLSVWNEDSSKVYNCLPTSSSGTNTEWHKIQEVNCLAVLVKIFPFSPCFSFLCHVTTILNMCHYSTLLFASIEAKIGRHWHSTCGRETAVPRHATRHSDISTNFLKYLSSTDISLEL